MANERQSLKGTHQAKVREYDFGMTTGNTQQECIAVMFEITKGEFAGRTRERRFVFSDGALPYTLEMMRHCGWRGETLFDMTGFGDNEVNIVIVEKKNEQTGKTFDEIAYVNRLPRLSVNKLNDEKLKAFSERMERLTRDSARSYGVQPTARAAGTAFGASSATQGAHDYDAPPDDAYG